MDIVVAQDYRKVANGILEAWVQNNTGRFRWELDRARALEPGNAEDSERVDLLVGIADRMGGAATPEEARVYLGLLRHLAATP